MVSTRPSDKFFKEACVVDRQKKNKARVSAFWEQCFDGVKKEFISLKELMEDKKYPSYHMRRASNQKLAETTSVSGIAQYFRTGWQSRAINTVFDYVVGTKTLTNQAGKALGGWTTRNCSDEIQGGIPPKLESIRTHADQVSDFVQA